MYVYILKFVRTNIFVSESWYNILYFFLLYFKVSNYLELFDVKFTTDFVIQFPSTVSRYKLVRKLWNRCVTCSNINGFVNASIMEIEFKKYVYIEKFVGKIDTFEYLSKREILHRIIHLSRGKFLSYDPWTPITRISRTIPTLCYSNMFYYRGGGIYVAT